MNLVEVGVVLLTCFPVRLWASNGCVYSALVCTFVERWIAVMANFPGQIYIYIYIVGLAVNEIQRKAIENYHL